MNPALKLSLMFGLGLLIQSVFLIKNDLRKNIWWFLGALAPSLVLGILSFAYDFIDDSIKLDNAGTYFLLLIVYIIFIVFFINLFFYEAIQGINEKILLVWTLIFWYAYAVNFGPFLWLGIIFLFPTFIVVIVSFAPSSLDYFWKAFLYGWFLFVLIFLAFIQVKSSNLHLYLDPHLFLDQRKITASYDYLTAFSAGMIFLSIALYGYHLLCFWPLPAQNQSLKDRFREIREHAINLGAKYSDYQMEFVEALIIFFLIGGIFLGNYYFKIASSNLIINLGIIGSFLYSERPMRRGA